MNLSFVAFDPPRLGKRSLTIEAYRTLPAPQKKEMAQDAVTSAYASGRLVMQPCCVCGKVKTHAHHESYSEPFRVTFLCSRHHRERHVELGWGIKKPGQSLSSESEIMSVSLPGDLKNAAKLRAATLGKSFSAYVVNLIRADIAASKPAKKGVVKQ